MRFLVFTLLLFLGLKSTGQVIPTYAPEEVFEMEMKEFRKWKYYYRDSIPKLGLHVYLNRYRIICMGFQEGDKFIYWRIFSMAEEARNFEFIKNALSLKFESIPGMDSDLVVLHLAGERKTVSRNQSPVGGMPDEPVSTLRVQLKGLQIWNVKTRKRVFADWHFEKASFTDDIDPQQNYAYECEKSVTFQAGTLHIGQVTCQGKPRFPGGFLSDPKSNAVQFNAESAHWLQKP